MSDRQLWVLDGLDHIDLVDTTATVEDPWGAGLRVEVRAADHDLLRAHDARHPAALSPAQRAVNRLLAQRIQAGENLDRAALAEWARRPQTMAELSASMSTESLRPPDHAAEVERCLVAVVRMWPRGAEEPWETSTKEGRDELRRQLEYLDQALPLESPFGGQGVGAALCAWIRSASDSLAAARLEAARSQKKKSPAGSGGRSGTSAPETGKSGRKANSRSKRRAASPAA